MPRDLCLQPHEVGDWPSGEPLCAPADERVRVESGPRAGDYLVRFLKSSFGGEVLVARREAPASPLLYVIQHELADGDIARKLEGQMFNRLLHFDADCRLARSLNSWRYNLVIEVGDRGDVNWCSREKGELGKVNLRRFDADTRTVEWRCPVNWTFDTPDAQIERDIQRMLRDKAGYFALAHDWKMSDEAEQSRRLARFANGDWDEFMHRLHDLILSFDELDASVEWRLITRVHKPRIEETEAEFFAQITMETHLASGAQYLRLSEIQTRIFEAVMRYFHPTWNNELNDSLIRHGIRTGKEINFPIQVAVPAASAHERLEARLQLRDFLRAQANAPELAELLG